MNNRILHFYRGSAVATLVTALVIPHALDAGPRGGSVHRSVNRSTHVHASGGYNRSHVDVNRNVHRDTHVNVDRRHQDIDIHRDVHRDVDIDVHNRYYGRSGFVAGAVTGLAVGAAIATLPRGYRTVYVGSVPYAYSGGVYYQSAASGYVVVDPPVGAIIPELPAGAVVTVRSGVNYYVVNQVYYQPVIVSGVTQYRVVRF
ncbi:DUF6515 family protein [Verrucomicrobium spinosum]|uniref:DUF6515 family protein n=1 Tax=Verrucomicrobium spinosum TaxID=2736 RepID=UPI0001745079|nr:DUF6515 family protein [Verrucomicrobium spinosum]